MASKQFAAALGNINKEPKNLTKLVKSNEFIGECTDEFTIQAVDITNIDKDQLGLTFINNDGLTHKERLFLMDSDKAALSFAIAKLLAGVLPDTDAMGKLLTAAESNDRAWEMLTGMKLQMTLKFGKGFRVAKVDGGYQAFDYIKGVKFDEPLTDVVPTIKEAREIATSNGFKGAFLNMYGTEATHAEANIKALEHALVNAQHSQRGSNRSV